MFVDARKRRRGEGYREIGMNEIYANGAHIPALGLGTWTLKDRACSELVEHALAVGYRHVDTASSYHNEEAVGAGIRASGVSRDDIFLTTKVWPSHLAPAEFMKATEASLGRLGLDHVDLLLIHWPNREIPLKGTVEALNRARREGLARHIGVANFTTALLADARKLSEAPLVCNQVEYHPYLDQRKVLEACREAGMATVAYCPLHRGGELLQEEAVRNAAGAHGVTPGQVVLRWLVQQEGVAAIPRTSRKERLTENIGIFGFTLSDAEMRAISALSARNSRLCDFDFSPEWD
jgi:diketogulonate reductase-like aldo/keto reductase